MCDQDFCEGSPLHLGVEEDVPNQVTHGTTLIISDGRICKWIDGLGRTRLDREKPFADLNKYFKDVCGDDSLEKKQSLL
jgi:hypothetical protein